MEDLDCEDPLDCLEEDEVPHICTPDTRLADFMWNLAHSAWSCLANTPNGLPGNEPYTWMTQPSIMCCDTVVAHLSDSRRFRYGEFGEEILNIPNNGDCRVQSIQHEVNITLMRPCAPILSPDDGMPVDSKVRQKYGRNFMIDAQTMLCCLQECLDEDVGGLCSCDDFYIKPARYYHAATCASMTIPIVIGGSMFKCCGCADKPTEIDITPEV